MAAVESLLIFRLFNRLRFFFIENSNLVDFLLLYTKHFYTKSTFVTFENEVRFLRHIFMPILLANGLKSA